MNSQETKLPEFWVCDGTEKTPTRYGFGYWTGPEKDLLCVVPDLETNEEAHLYLSPMMLTPVEAVSAFVGLRRFANVDDTRGWQTVSRAQLLTVSAILARLVDSTPEISLFKAQRIVLQSLADFGLMVE